MTQPTDVAFASSANSPGSEGVANAYDNQPTKYLNFDSRTPNLPPSGFAISPAVGITRVTGIAITSANDAPERDPKTVILEGSNDPTLTSYSNQTWEAITTLNVTDFTNRFQRQVLSFTNFKPYRHYRWIVTETRTPNGCCMQVAEVEFLGTVVPQDITLPTDTAFASSANSPGSEGVANAYDNQPTKYLNFDSRTPNLPPSGFAISPSIGRSLLTGISITSANDAPERDPKTVVLEGSNDPTLTSYSNQTWQAITTINVPDFTNRFQKQIFLFENYLPYRHYRWISTATRTPNGCCMQVAEVEFLGTSAPRDVTQPGDPLIASSANSPGSEGVANVIDNQPTKYLNFDSRTPNNPPSGFVVSPRIGASTVIGMTIQSANDAPERDPKTVILEGSNDTNITGFSNGTWTAITTIDVPDFTNRFQIQEFYFTNTVSYLHYRWISLATRTPNGCCMQVAEVELLAVTAQNPCAITAFTAQPVDVPVLLGAAATFNAKVNGPWSVQWMKNGTNIPGATATTYTTPPIAAGDGTNAYTVVIVGCQTSQVARAVIFTPSANKSIGVNIRGQGANGAPTSLDPTDIAGATQQAYWNNVGGPGFNTETSVPLVNSDNVASPITFSFAANNQWGAGTGTETGDDKMLNGYSEPNNGQLGTFTFENVPAGTHSILVYSVNRPLAFNDANFSVTTSEGNNSATYYIRAQNADEYNANPRFVRGSSTNPTARTVANYVRIDNITLAAAGSITLNAQSLVETGEVPPGAAPVNGLQLLISPPVVGQPPTITAQPSSRNVVPGSTTSFSVTASGTGPLTYQWRRNGVNLTDGGNISGATSSTLTINNVSSADSAAYTVVVSNPSGSTTSSPAVLTTFSGSVMDRLAGYWKFDETSGFIASNSAPGGVNGVLNNYVDNSGWSTGKVGGSLIFDGAAQFVSVSNFTKPTSAVSGSAWVYQDVPSTGSSIIANPAPVNNAGLPLSPFDMGLTGTGDLRALITVGPNNYIARAGDTVPLGTWEHVAFVANGSQLTLYTNGLVAATVDYSGQLANPAADCLGIGGYLDPATCNTLDGARLPWAGRLDEVALWTRALGASEIQAIYAAGQTNGGLANIPVVGVGPRFNAPVKNANGTVTFTWTGSGRLQSNTNLMTPATWTDVTPQPTGNTYTTPATGNMRFYRIIQ